MTMHKKCRGRLAQRLFDNRSFPYVVLTNFEEIRVGESQCR